MSFRPNGPLSNWLKAVYSLHLLLQKKMKAIKLSWMKCFLLLKKVVKNVEDIKESSVRPSSPEEIGPAEDVDRQGECDMGQRVDGRKFISTATQTSHSLAKHEALQVCEGTQTTEAETEEKCVGNDRAYPVGEDGEEVEIAEVNNRQSSIELMSEEAETSGARREDDEPSGVGETEVVDNVDLTSSPVQSVGSMSGSGSPTIAQLLQVRTPMSSPISQQTAVKRKFTILSSDGPAVKSTSSGAVNNCLQGNNSPPGVGGLGNAFTSFGVSFTATRQSITCQQ